MVGFNNLPNELVVQIIRLALPEDLESFTSTCKLVRELARNSLNEHRAFKRKYRDWITSPGSTQDCLYGLLRAILRNPRIARYVETLEVHELLMEWMSEPEDTEAISDDDDPDPAEYRHTGVMTVNEEAKFRNVIQECIYVPGDDFELWWDALDSGEDDPILALLVTLLPNLKRLDIQLDTTSADLFFETIRRISAASSTSNTSIPLSRLSEVAVRTTELLDRRPYIDVGCLWPFFALPSVRSVTGERVRHDEMIPLPERSSDVISLYLEPPCDIAPEKIKNLFSIFKGLQVFELLPEPEPCSQSDSGTELMTGLDVQAIHESLIEYAKLSLKEFSLCIEDLDDWDQAYTGSFRAFEVLKVISINAILLLGKPGLFRKTLAEVLPMSIEDITIQDQPLLRREYRGLVFKLLSVKQLTLPNLKSLSFRDSFSNDSVDITEDKDGDLKVACTKAGFILMISRSV